MTGSPSDPQPGWNAPGGWQSPAGGGWGGGDRGPGSGGPEGPRPGGWNAPGPARRSGLIELRPLTLSDFLDGSFRAIQRNPGPTLGLALLVQLVVAVLTVGVLALLLPRVAPELDRFVDQLGTGTVGPQTMLGASFSLLQFSAVSAVIGLFGQAIVNGLMIVAVSRAILGEKPGPGAVWRTARRRFGALIAWGVLVVVVPLVGVGVVVLLAVALGQVSPGLGAGLGVLGSMACLVVLVWLSIRLLLVPPALVLERVPLGRAVARSWALTRGSWWRLLGVYLLSWILVQAITSLLSVPVSLVVALVAGAAGAGSGGTAGMLVTSGFGTLISGIGIAYLAAVVSLQYIDLRIRREALDVQLAAELDRRGRV